MDDAPSTRRTKRALRALAAGHVTDTRLALAAVVDEATDALSDVDAAARFLAAGGSARLARAVVQARRAGDDETVSRGREALAALCALESALDGDRQAAGVTEPRRPASPDTAWAASAALTHPSADGSLSPRSRNRFTGRRRTGRQMKRGDR